jgi:hypothetical protein
LTRDQWTAYLLLRDRALVNPRVNEQAVDFYDPRNRTFGATDDPIFDSMVAAAQLRREENICAIVDYLSREHAYEPVSDMIDKGYDDFAGPQEFDMDVALARLRVARYREETFREIARKDDVDPSDGEDPFAKVDTAAYLVRVDTAVHLVSEAQREADSAVEVWRGRLNLYINRIRLASMIIARRTRADMSQEQFAAHAQVSASTVKNYESVEDPARLFSTKTINLMEEGLGWEPGGIASVMRGGEPKERPDWSPAASRVSPRAIESTSSVIEPAMDSSHSRVAVRLENELLDLVRELAVSEERSVSVVLADAIRFYAKYHSQ